MTAELLRLRPRRPNSMKPSTVLLNLAVVATHLSLGTDGFVSLSNLVGTSAVSRCCRERYDAPSSSTIASSRGDGCSRSRSRYLFPRNHISQRSRCEPSSRLMMMAAGKKRRRRKVNEGGGASAPAKPTSAEGITSAGVGSGGSGGGAGQLGDVLEGDRKIEELFTDDWSDMPANVGMTKSNVKLPDITDFKSTRRAETTLEQRQKSTAVGLVVGKSDDDDADPASRLDGFQSKLTPIVDREEERRKKSAAERFEEGPIVKGLKTITWFSICSLVLWEIYIHSPWFHVPENSSIL